MDRRRLSGLLALIVLVGAFIALLVFDSGRQEPVTAFAPAESADESVPPPAVPGTAAPADTATAPDAATAPGAEPAPVDTAAAPGAAPADATTAAAAPAPAAVEAGAAMAADDAAPAADRETTVALAAPPATDAAGAIEDLVEGAAPAPMPEIDPGVPSFDVVRVEPTGEAVIAGQAEPNATVEVLDGTEAIATAQASDRGEWVVTLEEPLAPGAHDLAVRTTSADKTVATLSDQRVTVSVPETGNDVLVVLNDPDEASRVLQVPTAETPAGAAATGTEVAALPADADAGKPIPPAAETPEVAMVTPGEPPADRETLAPPAETVAAAPEAPTEAGTNDTEKALDQQTAALDKPAETPMAVDVPAPEPNPAEVAVAPAAPEIPVPPPPPEPEVVVAAVEADTAGTLFVAGTAKTGETVRVYLDDAVLGDAEPSPTGTWLIEVPRDMPAGSYTVRADQVDGGGAVIARSEVPFEREVDVATLRPTAVAATSSGAAVAGTMPEMQTVIIKRGDNLWRIARSTWGKGVRWSTIYEANTDQIRNPDRIYPGQVFMMPAGDTTWQN